MNPLVHDLRHAVRMLLRSPGFTAVAVLALALGIGANAAIFSLVHGVLIEPLPYPDPERLVRVGHVAPGLDLNEADLSDGTFLHYRRLNRVFEDLSLYNENTINLSGLEGAERVPVALVTPGFLAVLGARPALGRLFAEQDGRSAPTPVIISHSVWRRVYGSDSGIVGRTIELNSAPKLVVGVLEPGFAFPRPETEIWYASAPDAASASFAGFYYQGIARLRPGVSIRDAEAELNRLIPSLAGAFPDATPELLESARLRAVVGPLKDAVVGDIGAALWILLGAAGFVLLIACVNVANLFLVRAEHRSKELVVRAALGARRRDLARGFLSESAVLATLGGALGLFLADAGVQALVRFGPAEIPRLHEVGVDAAVLAFAALVTLLAGLTFGLVPAVRHSRPGALVGALAAGSPRATAGPTQQRGRRILVAAQIALALTLLAASGLMVRSFWRLAHADPGFEAEGVLTAEIALPGEPYPDFATGARLWHDLVERVRALPGVEAAGAVSDLPLASHWIKGYLESPLAIEERPLVPGELAPRVSVKLFTPGYFEAMRIPLVAGRGFRAGDRADDTRSVLVSGALARRFFPGRSALGNRVRRADAGGESSLEWNTIAGVMGDVRDESIWAASPAAVYVPILDRPVDDGFSPSHMSLAIRTSPPPLSLVPALRRVVRELDPNLPVANVRTMERIVAASTARTSFTMLLLMVAAAMALFLGALGLYGVISYTVTQRTRELGVRIALGARPADVQARVVRQGAAVALAGLAGGVLGALALTRLLAGLLFEVSAADPATFVATSLLLLGVTLLASYIPARRAASVDPIVALRAE